MSGLANVYESALTKTTHKFRTDTNWRYTAIVLLKIVSAENGVDKRQWRRKICTGILPKVLFSAENGKHLLFNGLQAVCSRVLLTILILETFPVHFFLLSCNR